MEKPYAKFNVGDLLEQMAEIKIKRDNLSSQDKPLKEQYDELGEEVMRRLEAEGSTGQKSKRASVSISEVDVPVLNDITAFAKWALRTGNTHVFTSSCVSSPAWREVIALNAKHTPPPGTEVFTKKNLNFRLIKGA